MKITVLVLFLYINWLIIFIVCFLILFQYFTLIYEKGRSHNPDAVDNGHINLLDTSVILGIINISREKFLPGSGVDLQISCFPHKHATIYDSLSKQTSRSS